MSETDLDRWHMARALELAALGRGAVEPNPLVGCVIVQGAEVIGEGYHRRIGGPHAEIEALEVAGSRASGATMYVTLEPCCHWGKTPPCSEAVIRAGLARVVVALLDPFPQVAGGGLAALRQAGIEVESGVLRDRAQQLNAPYLKRLATGQPWVIAKWAMTLDGKLATRSGSSRWISSPASQEVVHALRQRVDAILVGRGTVEADDPLLTARPAGARTALRIVLDRQGRISLDSRLVQTARETPVLIATGPKVPEDAVARLQQAGCEVWRAPSIDPTTALHELLSELGRRQMTNILVEGGADVFGSFFDASLIDEVHCFIAPKLIGGRNAPSPVAGNGLADLSMALQLTSIQVESLGDDVYVRGVVPRLADL